MRPRSRRHPAGERGQSSVAGRRTAAGRGQSSVADRRAAGERGQSSVADRRAAGERGQSSVEVVAILPVLVIAVLAAAQLLAAGAARELAANAAGAGAAALLQGLDPVAEARAAVPGWSRSRMSVRQRGRRVEVVLRPAAVLPPLTKALTARVSADAGPDPGAPRR